VNYGKVLIATGSEPIKAILQDKLPTDRVFTYRHSDDLIKLQTIVKETRENRPDQPFRLAIVGSDILGTELSVDLAKDKENVKVTYIIDEENLSSKIFPKGIASLASKVVSSQGIIIMNNTEVLDAELKHGYNNDSSVISLECNSAVSSSSTTTAVDLRKAKKTSVHEFDAVVVNIGAQPNTKLAEIAGLEVDKTNGGIIVNAELCARNHNVFVAGNVASIYDSVGTKTRKRITLYENARMQGAFAEIYMTQSSGSKKYNF
jgi:NAD(P)H-nitrite reductase large subunit